MRAGSIAITMMILCVAQVEAQTAAAGSEIHPSTLGYGYSLPSTWDVVSTPSTLASVKEQAQQSAASDEEKKGLACVQIALTARHGDPTSVLVVVELPFACFGQSMTPKDLPGFAQGASEGIKQSFDVSDPVYGEYKLGSHSLWIERAKGTPKGHPEAPYTVEVACTLLKKGAVCWMALAAGDEALNVFEGGSVKLEDDAPIPLVPASAFEKKPTS